MGIEPTRPAWKAGILPLNYTRRCNGHYYSQTGANCQGILKNFFLFQCTFPKCVFVLYHILHQDAREIRQKSFVFSLRFYLSSSRLAIFYSKRMTAVCCRKPLIHDSFATRRFSFIESFCFYPLSIDSGQILW